MTALRMIAVLWTALMPAAVTAWCQEAPNPTPPSRAIHPATASDGVLDEASSNHRLTSGDTIEVRVFQETDLDARVTLSKDGRAALPLIGEVALSRQTTTQAAQTIAERYKKGYLKNPRVTVSIVGYARQRFTILGAVNKPGSYFFPTGESLSLLQVIGMAGGYTRAANPSRITVQRGGNQGRVIEVDAKRLARSSASSPFQIQPGDVITVAESIF